MARPNNTETLLTYHLLQYIELKMSENKTPTQLSLQAGILMLNKDQVIREKINENILETEKEIKKTKADLIIKEDKLNNLKALTDEDLTEIIKEYDKCIDEILEILDKQNSEDAKVNAAIIRSLREGSDSELPKPS